MNKESEIKPIFVFILYFLGLIIVSYLSLIVGAYAIENDISLLNALGDISTILKENTFVFTPFNSNAFFLGFGAYTMICLLIYVQYEQNKKTLPGKEYGTAKFMTKSEIRQWNKDFADSNFFTSGLASKDQIAKEQKEARERIEKYRNKKEGRQ